MRRAILALAGTAAGTTLLIGLKAGLDARHPVAADTAPPPGVTAPPPSAAPPPAPDPGPPPPSRPGAPPAPPASPARPGAPAPAPPPPGGLRNGTFTGPVAQTRYGPVQVQIVVAGGRMTDVTALQTPSSHNESIRINRRAAPLLREEALAAQSADIDTVSGASYTSKGYRTSLQAALDAARRG
jgi:uncharacterized protein with FMN-binding domain